MSYRVAFSLQTLVELKNMEQHNVKIVLRWVENHLEDCENPRRRGNGFSGSQSTVWRYSIGAYRLMAEIDDGRELVVLIWLGSPYGTDEEEL